MIPRSLETALMRATTTLPVVSLSGPRQSGKSTLAKNIFPGYSYVNLENPLLLAQAKDDPEGFLDNLGFPAIIDEAQHFPELFSYIQLRVDAVNKPGMYVLSGSQNFLMMEAISQSLAGRVTILKLYPFSAQELELAEMLPKTTEEWVFQGGYPRLYDAEITPAEYYPSYLETYLQRDVRTLRKVGDLSSFTRFLAVLAGRVGQLLVFQELADATDVSVKTIRAWLSILETSYIVMLLKPLHKNVTSRNVKSPKLYFVDTGLACSLLGLTEASQLRSHYLYGALFENMVVSEMHKHLSIGTPHKTLGFWRNNKKQEIDLLLEVAPAEVSAALEIKSSRSPKLSHFATLDRVAPLMSVSTERRFVVYDGQTANTLLKHGSFLPWRQMIRGLFAGE